MKKIYFFFILLLCVNALTAQDWTSNLPNKGDKPYTFYEIQNAFYDYWKPFNVQGGYYSVNGQQVKASGYNQFKRWEWYWENRVDPITGEFPEETAADVRSQLNKTSNSRDNLGNWLPMGPTYSEGGYYGLGRINCIAFVPGVANRFYVGSPSGGLWKTEDGGSSWTAKTDNNQVIGVSDAVVIPGEDGNSDIIYIATGDRDGGALRTLGGGQNNDNNSVGVLKSINGGANWTSTLLAWSASQKRVINRLLIHPTNNNIIYAATSVGLYKIIDGDQPSLTILTAIEFIDIEFKPSDPMTIYGATKTGKVYVSTDGGSSWPKISLEIIGAGRVELAVSPNEPTWVYAVITDKRLIGIYKSVTSGDSFNLTFNGLYSGNNLLGYYCNGSGEDGQAHYDLCLAVDPNDADILYLGGINTWKSINGGNNWNISNIWTSDSDYNTCNENDIVHADKHAFGFQPGTNFLFEGNDGGVYKTINEGYTWQNIGNGLVTSQIYRLGVSQTYANQVIIGLQDNGGKARIAGAWETILGGDAMECIIDSEDPSIQYGSQYYAELYRTTNNWQNSTCIYNCSGTKNDYWVTPFVMDPNNHNTLYVGLNEVFKTTDQGDNWTQISNIYFDKPIIALAVAPSNSNVVYAASKNYITKTTDGGNNWEDITDANVVYSSNITYISVKENDPNTAWVSLGQYNSFGVYEIYETPGSESDPIWTDISNGLPNVPVMCVIQNKQSLAQVQLFAATDLGVYMKMGSSDWVQYSNSLPNVVVTELEIYYKDSDPSLSRLWAATYGRGLWRTDMEFDNSSLIATPNDLLEYYDAVVDNYRDKIITLTNNSYETITVSNIELTGDYADQFTITGPTNFDILPATQQDVTVRFSPTEIGEKDGSIVITNNSQDSPVLTIPLHGTGVDSPTKRLIMSPDITYNYGDVTVANSKTKTFYLLNTGSDTFTVTDLSLTGPNEDNYSIVSQPQIPFDLENGVTKQARIRFTPTSNGSKTVNFVITSDADNGDPTYEIVLFGNGKNGIDHNTIKAYEYWFDDNYLDKIFTLTNSGQVASINTSISTDSLDFGLHSFHIRFKDENSHWGPEGNQLFYKLPEMEESVRKLVEYEYWFDNDYEAKVTTAIDQQDSYSVLGNIDVSSMPLGIHIYHSRFKDDAGQWSTEGNQMFYILPEIEVSARTLVEYESWFDNDYEAKVTTAINQQENFLLAGNLDIASLPFGLHTYHARFKDDAGQWSSEVNEIFYKLAERDSVPKLITGYRYWYDMDDDNLTTVVLPVPVNPYELITNIEPCSFEMGEHTVHFQFKDDMHAWSSVVTDTFNVAALQALPLNTGWNIASFSVLPNQVRMDSIFKPMMDDNTLVKVIDESGNFIQYIPGLGWLNTIGNMSPTEGYYTKLNASSELDLTGLPFCTPFDIPLNQGWNIMGYPLFESQDALNALQYLTDNNQLVKVVNESGGFIQYIPGLGWLNTIGDFTTGEGYYIKVNTNTSISLDDPTERSTSEKMATLPVELFSLTYEHNPYYPMNIVVTDISVKGKTVEEGDEIAVFDEGRCVGAGVIVNYQGALLANIIASQDDPLTEIVDGYVEGNGLSFKYLKKSLEQPIDLYPVYIWGSETFDPLGTQVCTLADNAASVTENYNSKLFMSCYPNPTTGRMTIDYILPEEGDVKIELMDMYGNKVDIVEDGQRDLGTHQIKYNMTTLSFGVYVLRMNFKSEKGEGFLIQKVVKQ